MEKTLVSETVPVYVGLDYHASFVQMCVLSATGAMLLNRRCANTLQTLGACVQPGWEVRRATMESCCGAADLAEEIGTELGWPISLAHPGYVNRMKLNPDKTDHSDARMLAELAVANLIPKVWLPPKPVRELRLLVRLRADLVGRVRAIKTRLLGLLRNQRVTEPSREEIGGRWTQRWMRWLSGEAAVSEQGRFALTMQLQELSDLRRHIHGVEGRLEEVTRDDGVVKRLRGIKGIGAVTAWTMRAMIGQFDRFANGKQLARFCGLSPRNASSGRRMADAGLIKAGDDLLKSVLIEAAHRLRRYDSRWKEFGQELAKRGKHGSVIAAAVANRWVRGLFHQMKEDPA